MIDNKKILAIIPARAKSTRLPGKNINDFVGKPLIAWTIESALKSSYIDRVIVSTDDSNIANISKFYGADVPFMRPTEISLDSSPSIDLVIHAVEELSKTGDYFQYIILLQPTSPLRSTSHINEAIELLKKKRASNIVSVTLVEHPVEWTNTLPLDLSMKKFMSNKNTNMRSQDYPVKYSLNGAIYIVDIEKMLDENKLVLQSNSFAYVMAKKDSIDIDTIEDWDYAEYCAKKLFKAP